MATVNTVLVEGIGAGAGPRNLLLFGYGAVASGAGPLFISELDFSARKNSSVTLSGEKDPSVSLSGRKGATISLSGDRS